MMLERVKKRVNVLIWGTDSVSCAECGASLSPAKAVWTGREAYCSADHEARDHETVTWGAAAPAVAAVGTVPALSLQATAYRHAA